MEELQEQTKSRTEHLKPWQFKKGQSGNPAGRTPGPSLKEYAKKYLATLTEEERLQYMEGLDKKVIWEMAEGKPENKTDVTSNGETINIIMPSEVVERIDGNRTPPKAEGSNQE